MTIERSRRRVSSRRLAELAASLLDASPLCAVATVGPAGRAHVNTAYFAWGPGLDLVWISEPRAAHSRNLRANGSASVAVFDSRQTWGTPDRGIQLFGAAREAAGRLATRCEDLYAARFPGYRDTELGELRCYRFRPRRVKLFDEDALGAGVFVTAAVGAGGRLTWRRTEVYR